MTAAIDGNGSDKQLIHAVRRLTLRQRHHVPKGVHRDGDSGMAKVSITTRGDTPPHHSHALVVDAPSWGDEIPAFLTLVQLLSRRGPIAALISSGGDLTLSEAECHIAAGTPVIALQGTGRATDELTRSPDSRHDLVVVNVLDHDAVAVAVRSSGARRQAKLVATPASRAFQRWQPGRATIGSPVLAAFSNPGGPIHDKKIIFVGIAGSPLQTRYQPRP